jgi:ferrochelatase
MRTGVLLMAHGTPSSVDEMPRYLQIVRGGRPASQQLVEEMQHNYLAIGGRSPLTDLTKAQAKALSDRLGGEIPVAVGMRNWKPFITDSMVRLANRGVTRVIAIPMAPQFSTLSVEKYIAAATDALPHGVSLDAVESFHIHPLLLQAFAERLRDSDPEPDEEIVFTAHSLPARVVDAGDPYSHEVENTARGVAASLGLDRYQVAYQSAGRTPEPWIGPDLSELIRERAAEGVRRFLVAPIGFVCDHTEILFDIDIQAKQAAESSGATLRRTESLNTQPTFIALLEDLVRQRL